MLSSKTENSRAKWIASLATMLLVCYCGAVLLYVSTSFDVGVRCLMTNEEEGKIGVQIRQFQNGENSALPNVFGESPVSGDYLLELNQKPVNTFSQYVFALSSLRSVVTTDSYDKWVHNVNPLDASRYGSLPPVIRYVLHTRQSSSEKQSDAQGGANAASLETVEGNYVKARFLQHSTGEIHESWLLIRSLPAVEVVLSILWCLIQFAVFALAALSFCHRPQDRAAQLFFALCLLTLPAFVGSYHWWVISSSAALTIPFVCCAILLPVVTLQFYLNYPSRVPFFRSKPQLLRILLYTPAIITILFVVGLLTISYLRWPLVWMGQNQQLLLRQLKYAIDIYIVIAMGYFLASVLCMLTNYRSCQHPAERKQLQWILAAASLATPLIIFTVSLSFTDRVGMALGRGRIPMVVVSLLFLTAYAIGILRHRLMVIDEILSRRTWYHLSSLGITFLYSLTIAIGSLLTVYRGMSVPEQLFPLTIFLTISILILGWLRDRGQEMIDRRFFLEKYRLDRAMHQMNNVVSKVTDVRGLAHHMLRSCREVLQVRFSALYLRDGKSNQFSLVSSVGESGLPSMIELDDDSEITLGEAGSHQRISGVSKQGMPLLQSLHRQVNSQLMHGFEVDGTLSGIVVLGSKHSSTPFTAEDNTFVAAIGQMTGVALQCVRVQQNVSRLDALLQEKVRKIESQERQIAILKKQLDTELQEESAPSQIPAEDSFKPGRILGKSPVIQQLLKSTQKVAISDSSVLLRGESGTGKELLAQAIHVNSKRSQSPIISVNCAALSPALLESELFGHVRGAFTGADKNVVGRFQMADKGTLFLDEIGDISPDVQVKLLRVLQERQFEPVGGREPISVDVRLIAATHQNLEELIAAGKFREDLYYRLNVITLELPPLRDRKEDLFELSLAFLRDAAQKANKSISDIDDLAFRALLNYDWPGNIRELQNAIHRAVVLADGETILLENLPQSIQNKGLRKNSLSVYEAASSHSSVSTDLKERLATKRNSNEEEVMLLREAMAAADGNKAQAARLLGMPRSTFYGKLRKHKLK